MWIRITRITRVFAMLRGRREEITQQEARQVHFRGTPESIIELIHENKH